MYYTTNQIPLRKIPGITGNDTSQKPHSNRPTLRTKYPPKADKLLPITKDSYLSSYANFDSAPAIALGNKEYFEYMLLGKFPQGPFDGTSIQKSFYITKLIAKLISEQQFTALKELIAVCDDLYRIELDLTKFTPEKILEIFSAINKHHPKLCNLHLELRHSTGQENHVADNLKLTRSFIENRTVLTQISINSLNNQSCPDLLSMFSKSNTVEDLSLKFTDELSDETCRMLQDLLRNCTKIKSLYLTSLKMSEENSLRTLIALDHPPALEKLSIKNWNFGDSQCHSQFSGLIEKSKTLTEICLSTGIAGKSSSQAACVKALAQGVAKNDTLLMIKVDKIQNPDEEELSMSMFIESLKKHPTIQSIDFDARTFHRTELLRSLADLLDSNQNIIYVGEAFKNKRPYRSKSSSECATPEEAEEVAKLTKLVDDRLARNRAIAEGSLAKIFSNAFFPSGGTPPGVNHIGDPGLLLSEHILIHSPSVPNYQNTMIELALTVDETARLEAVPPPVIRQTNDPSIVIRNSTDNEGKPGTGS